MDENRPDLALDPNETPMEWRPGAKSLSFGNFEGMLNGIR